MFMCVIFFIGSDSFAEIFMCSHLSLRKFFGHPVHHKHETCVESCFLCFEFFGDESWLSV